MKKIIKSIFLVAPLSLFFVACSEDTLDEINRDKNNANNVTAKAILSDVITSTAVRSIGGDFNTYSSIFVEHEAGVQAQFNAAETREGLSVPSTLNNAWASLYSNIKNARIALAKCSEGGEQQGNYPTRGIAEILLALNSAILTDNFGDVPYFQAASYKDGKLLTMKPKLDKQQEIYKQIMLLLDESIVHLEKADESGTGSMGTYDFLYGGNVSKWKKLAYGLKARYALQTIKHSDDKNAQLQKIIEYVDNSFTSVADEAAFNIYNGSNVNPFYGIRGRDGFVASKSLAQKLIDRNDPRLRRFFVDKDRKRVEGNNATNYLVFENGQKSETKGDFNTSIFIYSQSAPTMIMSYHELLFIKAEAETRLGNVSQAQTTLKKAVVAAIANAENSIKAAITAPEVIRDTAITETTNPITTTEAEEYFDNSVLPLFNANALKEVMIQKYLATFGASGESSIAYNDIRRLRADGENLIELSNPLNQNTFPLRYVYGSSDTTANPNVKEATGDGSYIYTENVWWAGGKR